MRKDIEIIKAFGMDMAKERNAAIKSSKAKYILFADSAVTYDEDAAEQMAAELEKSGADMAVCGYDMRDDEGRLIYETPECTRRVMEREDMLCRVFYQTHYQGFVWNKLFRRSVLRYSRIRFYEDIPGSEELPFIVNYTKHAGMTVVLPQHLAHAGTIPAADIDLEIIAYERMRKKLRRFYDAQFLCEMAGEYLEAQEEEYEA